MYSGYSHSGLSGATGCIVVIATAASVVRQGGTILIATVARFTYGFKNVMVTFINTGKSFAVSLAVHCRLFS